MLDVPCAFDQKNPRDRYRCFVSGTSASASYVWATQHHDVRLGEPLFAWWVNFRLQRMMCSTYPAGCLRFKISHGQMRKPSETLVNDRWFCWIFSQNGGLYCSICVDCIATKSFVWRVSKIFSEAILEVVEPQQDLHVTRLYRLISIGTYCYPLVNVYMTMVEGSLEVKLPTIWTDEKQRWEESERREE